MRWLLYLIMHDCIPLSFICSLLQNEMEHCTCTKLDRVLLLMQHIGISSKILTWIKASYATKEIFVRNLWT